MLHPKCFKGDDRGETFQEVVLHIARLLRAVEEALLLENRLAVLHKVQKNTGRIRLGAAVPLRLDREALAHLPGALPRARHV